MTTFTNILPADYTTLPTADAFFALWCPPEPNATSIDWRMKDGKWQQTEGPDKTRMAGSITTVQGRNLGYYARLNEEGRKYAWMPISDFAAFMQGQPAQGATDDGELQRVRKIAEAAIRYLANIGESGSMDALELRLALELSLELEAKR